MELFLPEEYPMSAPKVSCFGLEFLFFFESHVILFSSFALSASNGDLNISRDSYMTLVIK